MGTLDQLIEDNIPNKDDPSKLVQEVENTLDSKEDTHVNTVVYHNVDGVHEYGNVSEETLKFKNLITDILAKEEFARELKDNPFISKVYAEQLDKTFNGKIKQNIVMESFTELLTRVNAESTLKIMLEDINDDKEKIKTEVVDTFEKFEETYSDLSLKKNDSIENISLQISSINEIISRERLSSHPNRIMVDNDKEIDYGNAPLKEVLKDDSYNLYIKDMNDDLALFIYQTCHMELPTGVNENNEVNIELFKNQMSIHDLEVFYESDHLDSSFAILNSYIFASKKTIDECKEAANNYQFQFLMTKLEEANTTIINLKYTKNVLEGLFTLNNWFMATYKSFQSLL